MSSDNLINSSYISSIKNGEGADQGRKVFEVKTPFGVIKNITGRRELAAFIFEEKNKINDPLKTGFTYKQLKELDRSLDKVNRLYNKHIDKVEQKKSNKPSL